MNKTKYFGPLIGAVTGIIPQCGFSVVMSDLYSKKAITIGTLIAVMLATSDEAVPIMLSNFDFVLPMLGLIGLKLLIAIVFGYLFDLCFMLTKKRQRVDINAFQNEHNHDCELTSCSTAHVVHCHENQEHVHKDGTHAEHKACVDNIFLDALMHTLQIALFLFVATFLIGLVIEYVGMDKISNFFTVNKYLEPFLAGLVGLIPSCASSVFLVEFYIAKGISFGALLSGLCAGSGIGIVVLFSKNKKHFLTNLLILISLYLIGSLCGLLCNLII